MGALGAIGKLVGGLVANKLASGAPNMGQQGQQQSTMDKLGPLFSGVEHGAQPNMLETAQAGAASDAAKKATTLVDVLQKIGTAQNALGGNVSFDQPYLQGGQLLRTPSIFG